MAELRPPLGQGVPMGSLLGSFFQVMVENIAKILLIAVKQILLLMPEIKRKSPDITQTRFWWGD
jgi:hypothetical protein